MNEVLCKTCLFWVDCRKNHDEKNGFCLLKDLFTYSFENVCIDYRNGEPMTEEEWEDANNPKNWLMGK